MTGPIFPKKIIRGANIEGVAFYPSQEHSKPEPIEKSANKNFGKAKPKEIEEAVKEAEKNGYRKGLKEGHIEGYEAGKNEGLEKGFKLGVEGAYAELKSTLELLSHVSDAFSVRQKEMFIQAKPELIKFALAICENLLRKTLSNPSTFASHIEFLLEQSQEILKEEPPRISLSPKDYEMLQTSLERIGHSNAEFKKLNFSQDPTMERGNCRIETSLGLLNFDIKRLLNDLERKALEVKASQRL